MEKSQQQVNNSKPLHNFPLSFLRWGKDYHINNRRCRRSSDHRPPSPLLCPPPSYDDLHLVSPCSDAVGDGDGMEKKVNAVPVTERVVVGKVKPEPREVRNRNGCVPSSCSQRVVESEKKEELNGEMMSADVAQKQWNLRPRRGVKNNGDFTNVELKEKACSVVVQQREEINVAKLARQRRIAGDCEGVQKEKKARVWISLSKEEIEEDIFIMTGSKPSRKPKKWPKPVQNNLDNSFPGLAFVGVSVDEYRRPDVISKIGILENNVKDTLTPCVYATLAEVSLFKFLPSLVYLDSCGKEKKGTITLKVKMPHLRPVSGWGTSRIS